MSHAAASRPTLASRSLRTSCRLLASNALLKVVIQILEPGRHAVEIHRQLCEFQSAFGIHAPVKSPRGDALPPPASSAPAATKWRDIGRCLSPLLSKPRPPAAAHGKHQQLQMMIGLFVSRLDCRTAFDIQIDHRFDDGVETVGANKTGRHGCHRKRGAHRLFQRGVH